MVIWLLGNINIDDFVKQAENACANCLVGLEGFCKSGVPVGEYLAHNPFAVVLYNKMMYERFGKLSADEFLVAKV